MWLGMGWEWAENGLGMGWKRAVNAGKAGNGWQ